MSTPPSFDAIASIRAIEAYRTDAAMLEAAQRHLQQLEADAALARGRLAHAQFLLDRTPRAPEWPSLEQARALYHALGDVKGEAEALFWMGTFQQVIQHDLDAALPLYRHAQVLAEHHKDHLLLSCIARHLGFDEILRGRPAAAAPWLEASVQLRRDIAFHEGVAAALVALAELRMELGDFSAARAHLVEATELASVHGAPGVAAMARALMEALSERQGQEPARGRCVAAVGGGP